MRKFLCLLALSWCTSPLFALSASFDRVATFGGTSNEFGRSVAIDPSNNDYVIVGAFASASINFGGGAYASAGSDDIFIARYTQYGNFVWSKQLGGTLTDAAIDVAIDSVGNTTVVGSYNGTVDFGEGAEASAGATDIFIINYDPDGVYQWSHTFGSPAADSADGVAVDSDDNILVTGTFAGAIDFGAGSVATDHVGSPDTMILKFNDDGTLVFANHFTTTAPDYGFGITADSSDNIIVTGNFAGEIDAGCAGSLVAPWANSKNIFVVKMDSSGTCIFQNEYESTVNQSNSNYGYKVKVDPWNNILVAGLMGYTINFGDGARPNVSADAYLLKLNSLGGFLWVKTFVNNFEEVAYGLGVDTKGNAIISGSFNGSVNFGGGLHTTAGANDIFVAAFDENGTYIWSNTYGSGGSNSDVSFGVTIATGNKPTITGNFRGTVNPIGVSAGGSDIFLLQLKPKQLILVGGSPTKSKYVDTAGANP